MFRDTHYQLRIKNAIATCALLLFYQGSTASLAQNSLPAPPDTGTPEEDFSAGGTRDSKRGTTCGVDGQSFAYLLGDKIRESTLSAYPTFWFYFPDNAQQVRHANFVVTELGTGKTVYEQAVLEPETGIIGIALPQEQQYALSLHVNYAWRLEVDCADANDSSESALEGWLTRVPTDLELQHRLAAAERERYQVYWQHDLLYDALNDLAQRRIAEPNNPQLAAAWKQLLIELGWQDLTQPAVEPYLLGTEVSVIEN